ncbi:MAG: hypothetical protein KME22_14355 [Hassallia sp. WJT32-NPBG1]|jgi:hypothetical protein|nr:hypothetical protein [Hassallia sp. WJT32-NPBG1]
MNEELKHKFYISTDKSKLDIKAIHDFLQASYWAENTPLAIVSRPKRFLKGLPCVHLTEFIESARMPVYLLFEQ